MILAALDLLLYTTYIQCTQEHIPRTRKARVKYIYFNHGRVVSEGMDGAWG